MPSARSSESEPVEIAPTETCAWSLIFITAPLPKLRSICPRAVSSACSRSTFISLLDCDRDFRPRPRTAPRRGAAGKCKQQRRTARPRPSSGSAGRRPRPLAEAQHGDVRQPRPRLAPVDAELLEAPVQPLGERRGAAALVVEGRASRRSASRGSRGGAGEAGLRRPRRLAARPRSPAAPPAGATPRKASVTCRFAPGRRPGRAARAPAPARRTSRSTASPGQAESAEEAKPFIAVHASAATCDVSVTTL